MCRMMDSTNNLVLPAEKVIKGKNSFTETGAYPMLQYSVMGPSLVPMDKTQNCLTQGNAPCINRRARAGHNRWRPHSEQSASTLSGSEKWTVVRRNPLAQTPMNNLPNLQVQAPWPSPFHLVLDSASPWCSPSEPGCVCHTATS